MLRFEVWGGAGEHGRSCYYVETDEHAILLDCGGKKYSSDPYPKLNATKIRKLDAVFLSHAHEDHCAGLPLLYQHGFTGEVWMTRPTSQQLQDYLSSWGKYVARQPLQGKMKITYLSYVSHAAAIRQRLLDEEGDFGECLEIVPGLQVSYGPSGHLVGAVWLLIQIGPYVLFYSGDYGGESSLLRATMPDLRGLPPIDLAIVDAAYGDDEQTQQQCISQIIETSTHVLAQGGKVWFPVPLHGRGHELAQRLMEAFEANDTLSFYCDDGLAASYTDLSRESTWLQETSFAKLDAGWAERMQVLDSELLTQSLASNEPAIYLLSDPMLQHPATELYVRAFETNAANAMIWTGHVYPNTTAADLLNKVTPSCFQIFHGRYKVHQGLPDVNRMLEALHPRRTILVHAEKAKSDRLQEKLTERGWAYLYSLQAGDYLEIP